MSKLVRVSEKNHKLLKSMVEVLDYSDIDTLVTEMIKCYQAKVKKE
jgi:hypothetical protein